MSKSLKLLSFTMVAALVIVAGYFAGKQFPGSSTTVSSQNNFELNNASAEKSKEVQKEAQKEQERLQDEFDSTDFVAAIPSYGPLVKMREILVRYEGDTAFGVLSLENAKNIEAKQDVVLYDTENNTMPLGGKVAAVSDTDKGNKKITINLPEGTNTQYLSNILDIITLETVTSKRLPLTALQTDENDKTFVWKSNYDETDNPNKISRLYIEAGLRDENFFEELGHKIDTYDAVIINPVEKMRSDLTYKIMPIELDAPTSNPIQQAWIDFEKYKIKKLNKEITDKAANCAKNAEAGRTSEGASGGAACGEGAPSRDPYEIFQSLIKKMNEGADMSVGGSSCGSCGQ